MRKKLIKKHREQTGKETKKVTKLETLKNLHVAYIPYNELFREGIIAGLGWAIGVTIGFAIISTALVFVLKGLGGLPFIGSFIADIVAETQQNLLQRSVFIPHQ